MPPWYWNASEPILPALRARLRRLPEGLQPGAVIRLVLRLAAAIERPPLLELVRGPADQRGPARLDAGQVGDEEPATPTSV